MSSDSSSGSGSGSPSAKGSAKWSYKNWKKDRAWSLLGTSRATLCDRPSSGGSLWPALMAFTNFWHFRLLIPVTAKNDVKHICIPAKHHPGPRWRITPSCSSKWPLPTWCPCMWTYFQIWTYRHEHFPGWFNIKPKLVQETNVFITLSSWIRNCLSRLKTNLSFSPWLDVFILSSHSVSFFWQWRFALKCIRHRFLQQSTSGHLKSDGKSTARNEVGTYNSEQVDWVDGCLIQSKTNLLTYHPGTWLAPLLHPKAGQHWSLAVLHRCHLRVSQDCLHTGPGQQLFGLASFENASYYINGTSKKRLMQTFPLKQISPLLPFKSSHPDPKQLRHGKPFIIAG